LLGRLSSGADARTAATVADVVSPPDGLILFCGMSIGFADTTTSYARSDRASLTENGHLPQRVTSPLRMLANAAREGAGAGLRADIAPGHHPRHGLLDSSSIA
jgi:hypothetical protein